MVCIEKYLHLKSKCRYHQHYILDILPVYLTRGISVSELPGAVLNWFTAAMPISLHLAERLSPYKNKNKQPLVSKLPVTVLFYFCMARSKII